MEDATADIWRMAISDAVFLLRSGQPITEELDGVLKQLIDQGIDDELQAWGAQVVARAAQNPDPEVAAITLGSIRRPLVLRRQTHEEISGL